MFKAMKSAILDRSNRGAAQVEHDEETACSESSGSEAANDQVLDSASSTHSFIYLPAPDDLRSSSEHADNMHHQTDTCNSGRSWHFTQYCYRHLNSRRTVKSLDGMIAC